MPDRTILLSALVLAGCGGNSAPRVARATPPPPAKIELFAHVKLPASTRDLESKAATVYLLASET